MLQTLERERPRTLPLNPSGVFSALREGYIGAWTQDRFSTTSTRDWTRLESLQEDLGYRQQLYGEASEVIDLSGREALGLFLEMRPHIEAIPSPTLPYRECARLVAQHMSLNKSDLARIFSISRPTLYSWISGDSEPREELHRQQLAFLGSIVHDLVHRNPRPLYHRFVYEPMPGETLSVFEVLAAETWDEDLLSRLLRKAESLTAQRDEHLGTTHRTPRDAQEQNLQDNLLSLEGQ